RPFHGNGIGLDEQVLVQLGQLGIETAHGGHVHVQRGAAQLAHQARRHVGGDRNIAARAQQDVGGGGRVVPADDQEVLGRVAQQQAAARQVAGGVLDADDVGNLG